MDVIQQIADQRLVERTIQNIVHRSRLPYDLQDLSQMVYLILIEYEQDKIVGMWQRQEMGAFLVGVIKKQLFSRNSTYYYDIIKPGEADEPDETVPSKD